MDQGSPVTGGDMPPTTLSTREPRRPAGLAAHVQRGTGALVPVTISDLSPNGCGVVSTQELTPGERMPLSVKGHGRLMVTVRWTDGLNAGLEFEPEPDPAGAAPVERTSERTLAHAEVMARRPGGPMWKTEVADISPDGCRLAWVARPREGDGMWIKFDGLEAMDARVCWIDGSMAGLRFTQPIHPAVFDLLLARLEGR